MSDVPFSKFKDLINTLGIDESTTRPIKKIKVFNKVKDNVPLVADYNYMADLLFLPTTKKGFKYLLVMVDLANDEFDIEPMKEKSSEEVLASAKRIFSRRFLKKPYSSIRTDDGQEFKGEFAKYMHDNNIYHGIAAPNRHQQVANVESLNRQLGRMFNGYMNKKETDTGKKYREWTDVVDKVREGLNAIRKKKLPANVQTHKYPLVNIKAPENKYKVGDLVYHRLERAEDALGNKQSTAKFREGDARWSAVPHAIEKVLYYPGKITYRYMLSDLPNVSYQEAELKPATETTKEWKVKEIIDKRRNRSRVEYQVWWAGFPKSEATWESEKSLIEHGVKHKIKEFKDRQKP